MGPLSSGNILVLNAGSSSLKFKLFSLAPFAAGVGGIIERIGDTVNSCLIAKSANPEQPQKWNEKLPVKDHVSAMQHILGFLSKNVSTSIDQDVQAVGHRIVHGLTIHKAVLLDDPVLREVEKAATLAPLHNPPGLQGVHAAKSVFKGVPQVGVFDTAFHQTMPPQAYMYGLPYELYEKHHIRRYGFHGTSHRYLVETTAHMLGKPLDKVNVITCHLGNGSSITAVKNGVSVDTSMGMTPLEGLLMGTRSGDMDPAIALHLINSLGLAPKDTDTLLNKKSGLLGVCGDSDLRAVIDRSKAGDERAQLALDMFVYRVRKYIGSYMAALGGEVDAVVFSAGIGENSSFIRGLVCEGLKGLGVVLDQSSNEAMVGGRQGVISSGKVQVLVVPTDEELSIAQQTLAVVRGMGREE